MTAELGKIITFYSYKGGTGRSMALANVAWILASNGQRVLALDWDLEAPGLHRYFHPFLLDKELTSTPGLIDYFTDVNAAAREAAGSDETNWWKSWTSLMRYTCSVDWPFPESGTIDLVPAGRQGPGYAERVAIFNWTQFYDEVGGGVFLEALKQELRRDYDYVLIDSRTGISDTAGICTVQMPDELVVCFTLNQQSIKGAAAIANSAWTQRLKPDGEPGLPVWPLPTRIELAESERLESMSEVARATFQRYLGHLMRDERASYWGGVQVLYQPIFAYEEILAPFVERHRRTGSMVGSMEVLTAALTGSKVKSLGSMQQKDVEEGFEKFLTVRPTRSASRRSMSKVYLSYQASQASHATRIHNALSAAHIQVFSLLSVLPGDNRAKRLEQEALAATVMLVLFDGELSNWQNVEVNRALADGKRLIPVLVGGWFGKLPAPLSDLHGVDLRQPDFETGMTLLITGLRKIFELEDKAQIVNPDDPEKGRWGGRSAANGRVLSAVVEDAGSGSTFVINLEVSATNGRPLTGEVVFHLHPSFQHLERRVTVKQGRATLRLRAWGAFTVGAEVDDGRTTLELDLSQIEAPELFRKR